MRKSKREKDERKELLSDVNNPSYVEETNESKSPEYTLKRSVTLPSRNNTIHTPTMRRQNSVTTPTMRPRKISVNSKEMSNEFGSTSSPPSSPKPTKFGRQLTKIEFQKLPFNVYTSQLRTPWAESIQLTIFLIMLALIVPSLIVIVIFIVIRLKTNVRTKEAERKKRTLYLSFMLITSLIKDLIFILVGICFAHHVPLPSPTIAYTVLLFIWCLFFLVGPLISFYMADVRQLFNFSTEKDNCLLILQHFNFESVKEAEAEKIREQEKYYRETYPKLSALIGWFDEYTYIKDVLNRKKIFFGFLVAGVVCITRFAIVLMVEVFSPRRFPVFINGTLSNHTYSLTLYVPCLVLNSAISLALSLFLCIFMFYSILWGICMIREWRYFNTNENDDTKTLIGNGPQAIAMWWKIRETLLLFSTSTSCWSVLITRILFVSSVVFIIMISVAMMMMRRKSELYSRDSTILSMFIDNTLLYIYLLIQCYIHNSIKKLCALATHALELKKLNVCYEISCATNLDSDITEKESNVRSRVRLLRGRLTLIQDLVTTLESKSHDNSFDFVNIFTYLSGCLVLTSILYAYR